VLTSIADQAISRQHATIEAIMLGDITSLMQTIGLLGIAALVFVESGLPFGFFLPGDTLLFSAGLFAAHGQFNVVVTILVIFAASALGAATGYVIGAQFGKRFIKAEGGLLFRQEYVEKASRFYTKHGTLAIILSRFVPLVRTFLPIVAGVAAMPYRRFMIVNTIGALLWASTIVLTGYFAGGWLESHGVSVEALVIPVIGLVVLLSLFGPLLHGLRDPKTRAALRRRFWR